MTENHLVLFFSIFMSSALVPGVDVLGALALYRHSSKLSCIYYSSGIILGKLILLTLAILFRTTLVPVIPERLIFVVGGLYITYFGFKIINKQKNPNSQCMPSNAGSSFSNGFLLSVTNPQAILFYLFAMPIIIPTQIKLTVVDYICLYAIISVSMTAILLFYIHLYKYMFKKFTFFEHNIHYICGFIIFIIGLISLVKGLL